MFYHEDRLQYEVEVDEPDPEFARLLQQAIGGMEGEMTVALQYLFQAAALPEEHSQYRTALLDTAAEELAHIELLATAVNKNLEDAPVTLEEARPDAIGGMAGMQPRHVLSSGLNAMPVDANGVPFDGSWITASGNLAADMYANVTAESTGRLLAARLYEMTDDPGMKDMLAFLIARDTMHQNQWLAILQDLGDPEELLDVHPIPEGFPDEVENHEFNYAYISTNREPVEDPDKPWTAGPAPDSEGEFSFLNQHDIEGGQREVPPDDSRTYNDPVPDEENDEPS